MWKCWSGRYVLTCSRVCACSARKGQLAGLWAKARLLLQRTVHGSDVFHFLIQGQCAEHVHVDGNVYYSLRLSSTTPCRDGAALNATCLAKTPEVSQLTTFDPLYVLSCLACIREGLSAMLRATTDWCCRLYWIHFGTKDRRLVMGRPITH